jgi:MEMO1 family protein
MRKRVLPLGWYPSGEAGVRATLENWQRAAQERGANAGENAAAVIVPHAGWTFSGRIAFETLRELKRECDTVIIVGGHMHEGEGVLAAEEKLFDTPLGTVENDLEFLDSLTERIVIRSDTVPDNTVEVQLPLVLYLYCALQIVWLRCGAGDEAIALGRACAESAEALNKRICVIGSTDLTHYGPNYGFTPHGLGAEALNWMKNTNDAEIVQAMRDMNSKEVLRLGNERKAACSSGAAVAAIEFARSSGIRKGTLVAYATSHDIHPDDSFVGYAGIAYSEDANR